MSEGSLRESRANRKAKNRADGHDALYLSPDSGDVDQCACGRGGASFWRPGQYAALGTQYHMTDAWMLNFGVAYDSKFQSGSTVSPTLPANDAWRFGVGVENQYSKSFSSGVAAEYAYGGTLDVNKQAAVPVALGGRGDLVGSYPDTGMFFLAFNFSWKF